MGLLGSPGKGKHANFERVRKGINDICCALRAEVVTPQTYLDDLEERLHHAQVTDPLIMHLMRASYAHAPHMYLTCTNSHTHAPHMQMFFMCICNPHAAHLHIYMHTHMHTHAHAPSHTCSTACVIFQAPRPKASAQAFALHVMLSHHQCLPATSLCAIKACHCNITVCLPDPW